MEFVKVGPSAILAPYIDCFWFYDGEAGNILEDRTFPDGCVEIVFNLDTTVLRSANNAAYSVNPEVEVIGQIINPYHVKCLGRNKFLGIRFFPHTFSAFSKVPLSEFVDLTVEAEQIMGKEFQSIAREIQCADQPLHKLSLLERFFLKKLGSSKKDEKKLKVLEFSVKHIVGNADKNSLDFILSKTGVNSRYLQRLFLHHIGLNPKLLLKIARFQRSLNQLKDHSRSLTEIALDCGYYDQAHFNHDFKSYTGMTPSDYFKNEFPINQYFLSDHDGSFLYKNSNERQPWQIHHKRVDTTMAYAI